MLTAQWEPLSELWSEMRRFQGEMDRLFESFGFDRTGWRGLATAYPPINVWEDAEHVYAQAELPGMALEDLEIYVAAGDQLTIKGERRLPGFERGVWYRRERGFGPFQRTVQLPAGVNADKVEAKFTHGILTIQMPKSEEAKPKKIPVKSV